MLGELEVGVHPWLLTRHPDVALVDKRSPDGCRVELVAPLVGLGRVPDLSGEAVGDGILHGAANGGRHPVPPASIRTCDVEFHQLLVSEGVAGQFEYPIPISLWSERMGVPVPVIEITEQGHAPGGRGPLPDRPGPGGGLVVHSHLVVERRERGEAAQFVPDLAQGCGQAVHAGTDRAGIGLEPGVVVDDLRRAPRHRWKGKGQGGDWQPPSAASPTNRFPEVRGSGCVRRPCPG